MECGFASLRGASRAFSARVRTRVPNRVYESPRIAMRYRRMDIGCWSMVFGLRPISYGQLADGLRPCRQAINVRRRGAVFRRPDGRSRDAPRDAPRSAARKGACIFLSSYRGEKCFSFPFHSTPFHSIPFGLSMWLNQWVKPGVCPKAERDNNLNDSYVHDLGRVSLSQKDRCHLESRTVMSHMWI